MSAAARGGGAGAPQARRRTGRNRGMASFGLPNRVALVTGAAKGIGFETARLLHERGASVTLPTSIRGDRGGGRARRGSDAGARRGRHGPRLARRLGGGDRRALRGRRHRRRQRGRRATAADDRLDRRGGVRTGGRGRPARRLADRSRGPAADHRPPRTCGRRLLGLRVHERGLCEPVRGQQGGGRAARPGASRRARRARSRSDAWFIPGGPTRSSSAMPSRTRSPLRSATTSPGSCCAGSRRGGWRRRSWPGSSGGRRG